MTFQTKLFAAATLASAIALAVAGTVIATTMARRTDERIEQTLVAEAKLAADLLGRDAGPAAAADTTDARIREFDAEADHLGALLDARVTLIARDGRVLSRDLLLTDVWGYRYTGGTRTVDVHIRRLREKLPLLATSLVTVKQFGYKLLEHPDASD